MGETWDHAAKFGVSTTYGLVGQALLGQKKCRCLNPNNFIYSTIMCEPGFLIWDSRSIEKF